MRNAIGTPIVMVATATLDLRKRLQLALIIMLLGIVSIELPGFGFSSCFCGIHPLLVLWGLSVLSGLSGLSGWLSGPGMQFHLVKLPPEASSIMLSLYGSILQLSIAAAGGIVGIAMQRMSVRTVSWIGAVSVAMGIVLAAIACGHSHFRRIGYGSD